MNTNTDNTPQRPDILTPRYAAIPYELKGRKQWVLWKLEHRDGRWTKTPYQPNGRHASSTDPATWSDYSTILDCTGYDGIGFVFTESDPYVGIDFDHCDHNSPLYPEIAALQSYAEQSVSGTGFHVIVKGRLPTGIKHRNANGLEVYQRGRYFTMTGHWVNGIDHDIECRQSELDSLCRKYLCDDPTKITTVVTTNNTTVTADDSTVIDRIRKSQQSDKFTRLWDGDHSEYPSRSEADAALVGILTFWTQDDTQVERLWRSSGLGREKLDRDDYVSRTIANCRSTQHYHGGSQGSQSRPEIPYTAFPANILPTAVSEFIRAHAAAMGCDDAYIALPLLSAVAGCIGSSRRIQIKRGWWEPSVLWSAIVAASGTLKTPAYDAALAPLLALQRKALAEHRTALTAYDQDKAQYDRDYSEYLRSKNSLPVPTKPTPPVANRYVVSDITIEKLAVVLGDNPRGLLLARDELAGWVTSYDQYKSAKGSDIAGWLELHKGGTLVVDRKNGSIYVPHAAVSVCGTVQPKMLARILVTHLFDMGFSARLLLSYPPEKPKQWTDADVSPTVVTAMQNVYEKLLALTCPTDDSGDLTPVDIPLTDAAQSQWIKFYNDHAAESGIITDGNLRSAYAKLEGYSARLALIVHCLRVVCDGIDATTIDEHSMSAGITLGSWFKNETRRVYAMMDADRLEITEPAVVVFNGIRKALDKGQSPTVRELQRDTCRSLSAESIRSAVKSLVGDGRITVDDSGRVTSIVTAQPVTARDCIDAMLQTTCDDDGMPVTKNECKMVTGGGEGQDV